MSRVGVNSVELACRGSVASASNAAKRLQRLRACFRGRASPSGRWWGPERCRGPPSTTSVMELPPMRGHETGFPRLRGGENWFEEGSERGISLFCYEHQETHGGMGSVLGTVLFDLLFQGGRDGGVPLELPAHHVNRSGFWSFQCLEPAISSPSGRLPLVTRLLGSHLPSRP